MSTCASSLLRVAVDAIEGLDVIGLFVSRLALLVVGLAVGACLNGERSGARSDGRASSKRSQEIATTQCSLAFLGHCRCPPARLAPVKTAARRPPSRSR